MARKVLKGLIITMMFCFAVMIIEPPDKKVGIAFWAIMLIFNLAVLCMSHVLNKPELCMHGIIVFHIEEDLRMLLFNLFTRK